MRTFIRIIIFGTLIAVSIKTFVWDRRKREETEEHQPGICKKVEDVKVYPLLTEAPLEYIDDRPVRLHTLNSHLGKTEYAFSTNIETTYNTSIPADCISLASVMVSVRIDPFTILIDKDVPKGSCTYNKVKAHEEEHARILRKTATEELIRMKDTLAKRLSNIPSRKNEEDASKQIGMEVSSIITEELQKMDHAILLKQLEIDTDQSYENLFKSCR